MKLFKKKLLLLYIFFTISWGCIMNEVLFLFFLLMLYEWMHDPISLIFLGFFFLEKTLCNACEINVFYLFPKIIF